MLVFVWGLLYLDWRLRAAYTVALLVFIALWQIPLQTGMISDSGSESRTESVKLWLISFNYANGSDSLSDEDLAYLATLAPLERLDDVDCHTARQIIRDERFTTDRFREFRPEDSARLTRILLDEVINSTHLVVGQRFCTFMPTVGFPSTTRIAAAGITAGQRQIRSAGLDGVTPPVPALHRALEDLRIWTADSPQRNLIYNHALSLVLLVGVGIAAIYRRSYPLLVVFLLHLALILLLMAVNIAANAICCICTSSPFTPSR